MKNRMKILPCIIIACCIILPTTAFAEGKFSWTMFLPAVLQQTTPPGYTRSSSGNIVTDNVTSLDWQDYYIRFMTSEADAIAYCEEMSLDGYDDWRFPNFSELQIFFKGVAADQNFDLRYWGSFDRCTASIAIGGYVKTPYGAEMYGGNTGDKINFSGGAAARCVRQH